MDSMVYLAFFQQQNPVLGFLPILLIFGIFYFLLFLPMQRQKKQTKKMLAELKNGDTVVTSGGLIGTIASIQVEEDSLILRVRPDNLRLVVARTAVSGLVGDPPKS